MNTLIPTSKQWPKITFKWQKMVSEGIMRSFWGDFVRNICFWNRFSMMGSAVSKIVQFEGVFVILLHCQSFHDDGGGEKYKHLSGLISAHWARVWIIVNITP